jgi:prevent-host-death family protein
MACVSGKRKTTMGSIKTVDARNQFADVVNRAAYGKERIVLTKHNREVAAVVPIEDLRLLQELEEHIDVEEALKSLAEARAKGTTSWDDLKAELGI